MNNHRHKILEERVMSLEDKIVHDWLSLFDDMSKFLSKFFFIGDKKAIYPMRIYSFGRIQVKMIIIK